jgi:urease alpha subunit
VGASCSDGDQCNGLETCNGTAQCIQGAPPVIDDLNPCTFDRCDPATGIVTNPPASSDSVQCTQAVVKSGTFYCHDKRIAPAFVEEAIATGTTSTQVVGGVTRTAHTSGTVQVVTEQGGRIVVTVNPFSGVP